MDATSEPMIRFEEVTKSYGRSTAVDRLSLDIAAGETVALVGPSGCGKTTTLKMVNRLVEATSGTIMVDGEDVARTSAVTLRRRIGYVIQNVGLLPHRTVLANTMTVPLLLGWSRRKARERAEELLHVVGLDPADYGRRYPHQLSGGQRQRVGVARALAADPPVLLMDEPFGAVDPIVRGRLQQEFLRLQSEVRKTVVFVTHDVDEAVLLGDRIAVMAPSGQGGRLAQYDEPARLLAEPADEFVADFVGADRGLKRLAMTAIDPALLVPVPDGGPGDPAEAVAADVSLRDGLAAILRRDEDWVAVRRGDEVLGALTTRAVHGMLRDAAETAAANGGAAGAAGEAAAREGSGADGDAVRDADDAGRERPDGAA